MAKAKNPSPNPDAGDEPENLNELLEETETGADAGDEEGESNFDKVLAMLTNPQRQGSGGVDMNMLLALEEKREARRAAAEARREAQAEKQFMMRMMLMMVQSQQKGPDPLMVEMIKGMMNNKQQEEFTRNMLEMQRNNSAEQIASMRETLKEAAALKDEITRETIEQIRESKDGGSDNPTLQIFREIKELAAPIIAAKVGVKPTATVEHHPQANPNGAPPTMTAKSEKERIPLFLRAVKQAWDLRDSSDRGKKRSVRGAISVVLMDVPNLAQAILDEDSDKAFGMCKEYVIADSTLLNWIQQDGVADWINVYLTKEIAPVLDSMMEAEEDGPTPDETETDTDTTTEPGTGAKESA